MKKPNQILIALCTLLLFAMPSWADNMPDYYPDSFDRWGIIDMVDVSTMHIVINDARMQLSPQIKVHSLNTRFSTINTLRRGMKVGMGLADRKIIDEIWILPRNYGHYTE